MTSSQLSTILAVSHPRSMHVAFKENSTWYASTIAVTPAGEGGLFDGTGTDELHGLFRVRGVITPKGTEFVKQYAGMEGACSYRFYHRIHGDQAPFEGSELRGDYHEVGGAKGSVARAVFDFGLVSAFPQELLR